MNETAPVESTTLPAARAPEQWFRTPELTQRLNLLAHLVQSSDLVLLVTAPEGGGKSTVAAMLAHHFEEQALVCRMRGDRLTDATRARSELLVCCSEQFALQGETLDEQLAEAASNLQRRARQAVLLVDDAHRASPEALESLLRLRDQEVWRLVFFLEPDITHPLLDGSGRLVPADAGHMVQIPPLAADQVEGYVAHRLRTAGISGAPPAERLPLRQMAESSGGVPGRIDAMIAAHLERGVEKVPPESAKSPPPENTGKPQRGGGRGRWKIPLAVALIGGLAGVALYYQEEINRLFVPPPERAGEPEPIGTVPGSAVTRPLPVPAEAPPAPVPEPPRTQAPAPEPAAGEGPADGVARTDERPPPAVKSEPEPAEPPAVEHESTPSEPAAPEEEPVPAPAASAPPSPADIGGTLPGSEKPAPDLALPKGEILEGQWLAIADGDHYTLQLASAGSLDALMKVAQTAGLDRERLAWYRTEYRGRTWYVLVHGDYPDAARARAAIRRLPRSVRRNKPWPRPIATVRKEIQEGK